MTRRSFEREYAEKHSKPCPRCKGAQEVAVCVKDGREEYASGNELIRLTEEGWEIDRFVPCSRCNQVGRVPR